MLKLVDINAEGGDQAINPIIFVSYGDHIISFEVPKTSIDYSHPLSLLFSDANLHDVPNHSKKSSLSLLNASAYLYLSSFKFLIFSLISLLIFLQRF